MDERAFHESSQRQVAAHQHAVYVYKDADELLTPLEHFLRDGFASRELGTFVHSFRDPQQARAFLTRRMPDATEREQRGELVTSHYEGAFERNGRIDHDHAVGVVRMLQESARKHHRNGTRIFVDASKNYFDAGRVDEWFEFESFLGPRLAVDVGLVCAYRASDLQDPDVLRRVLATHGYRFDAP